MKHILSIDGGGIRGIIPCSALISLEEQTGKLSRDIFDFVAGTSTGALLAAAMCVGLPAKQILEIYTKRSKEIFKPSGPIGTAKRVATGSMYDPDNLMKVLDSEFGVCSDWTLNDCQIRILLTAKGVNQHPWYFVRDNPLNSGTTGKLKLLDCAVASAAAPTYFAPWYVPPLGGALIGWCFDGGVGVVGNPVYQACVEAFYYDVFTPQNTSVISLGTGYYNNTQVNPPKGLIGTLSWTVDSLLNAPEDQQTEIVQRHFPGILQRFDWVLNKPIDMADIGSISDLVEIGKNIKLDWETTIIGRP